MTPDAALIRLRQYGERTSTWSTATYNDGAEKGLHEIALTLAAEMDRLRSETAGLRQGAERQEARTEYIAKQALRWKAEADGRKQYGEKLRAELAAKPAEVLAEAADAVAELRDTTDMNAADGNRYDFRQRVALRDAEDRIRRLASKPRAMADEAATGGAS
jgi:hypothetical protein